MHFLIQRSGRLLNEGAQVTASNVGADDYQAFAVLAADLVRAQLQVQISDLRQRDEADLIGTLSRISGYRDQQTGHTRYVGTNGLRQAHYHVEPAVALIQRAGLAATHGDSDRILNIRDIQTVACCFFAIDVDSQHRQTGCLFNFHFRRARYRS